MSQSNPPNIASEPMDYPCHRPLWIDLIGVLAGILLFFTVGLWFTKLYTASDSNDQLFGLVFLGFGLSLLTWLASYFGWLMLSNRQRRKRLETHRRNARENYQLGQVRQDIDTRR